MSVDDSDSRRKLEDQSGEEEREPAGPPSDEDTMGRDRNEEGASTESPSVMWIRSIQQNGTQTGWERLIDHYMDELLDYARGQIGRHLNSRVSEGDIVQEALKRALKKVLLLSEVRHGTFRKMLRLDIRRIACEEGRRGGEHRDAIHPMADAALDAEDYAAEDARSPASLLALEEEIGRIRAAIHQLPKLYRNVVLAIDVEQRDPAQLAAEIGTKPDTLRKQLNRGREKLRQLLQQRQHRDR